MKLIFLLSILIVVSGSQTFSQTSERLSSDAEGYSFAPPKGWPSETNANGFAMTNTAKTVLVIVKSHTYRDFERFLTDANLESAGLELVGKPQTIKGGQTFRTVKRSPQGMVVIDTAVLFSTHGGGIVIVAMSDEPSAKIGFDTGIAMAGSVQFSKPKVGAVAEQVRALLSGKLLTYFYTGNGYSERSDIILCSSGEAYRSTEMGGFSPNNVDGPSFSALSRKAGTWRISPDGGTLVIAMNIGGTFEYRLSARQASNEIGLNGKRFFVQNQSTCR